MILIAGNSPLTNILSGKLPGSEKIDDNIVNALDTAGIKRIADALHPEVIINCHEYPLIDEAEFWRGPAYDINSFFARCLAEICLNKNIKLVHISSSLVFSGRAGIPYKETDIPDPETFYGDSKSAGENMIKETGCENLIIRLPDILTETIDFEKSTLFRKNLQGFTCIHDRMISPTFAETAADAVIALISRDVSGLIHFSQGDFLSVKDLLLLISGTLGLHNDEFPEIFEVDRREYPAVAEPSLFNVLDNSVFSSETGIAPETFSSSLQRSVNNHREHYIRYLKREY